MKFFVKEWRRSLRWLVWKTCGKCLWDALGVRNPDMQKSIRIELLRTQGAKTAEIRVSLSDTLAGCDKDHPPQALWELGTFQLEKARFGGKTMNLNLDASADLS